MSSTEDSEDDETVRELCKQLNIKIPPKQTKQDKTKTCTSMSAYFNTPDLENVDLNNLPFLIVPDNDQLFNDDMQNLEEVVIDPDGIEIEQERAQEIEEVPIVVVGNQSTNHVESRHEVETEDIITEPIQEREDRIDEEAGQGVDNEISNNAAIITQDQTDHESADCQNETHTSENEEFGDLNSKRKRKSKGLVDKEEWTKNKCQKLRLEGEEYMGYRRDRKGEKFKVLHDVMKPARQMGNRCSSEFCIKSKLRGCNSLSESDYDFSKALMYDSIRPGRVADDPVVTDLRVLLYEPVGQIKYKLRYDDDYTLLPRRPRARSTTPKPKLYTQKLPIALSKWKHLQELKTVIPRDCHSYYDSLQHS